jgi:hypothetical protein
MSPKDSHKRRRLSLGVLAVAVAAGLAGAPPTIAHPIRSAGPADGHTLGGLTSQHWPVVVQISRSGKRIPLISAGIELTCTSGLDLPIPDRWGNVPIGSGGAVNASTTVAPDSSGSGVSLTGGTDRLTGRYNRKQGTFSGVWRVELKFSLGNGRTDDCKSGAVSFTAVL